MARHRRVPIAVLGDGGWGTALALHLYRRGHRVTLWSAFADYAKFLDRKRQNVKFLPGILLPRALQITSNLKEAVESAHLIIIAVPSVYLRQVLSQVRVFKLTSKLWLSAAKGLDRQTLKRMSQVVQESLGKIHLAVISGPNIAAEIARCQPASSVVASSDPEVSFHIQRILMDERMRIYTSNDVIGVELGGALKNPIAIAAGIGDGLGFGNNAKAALITRGIVEMARLGVAMGAREDTFWGLSGLGDLVTTCYSGRNRWLGEQLGRGHSLKTILSSTPMVIEGVETAKAATALGRVHRVELPIIEQVYATVFRGRSARQALRALMSRKGKIES